VSFPNSKLIHAADDHHSDDYEDIIMYPIDAGDAMGTSWDWNLWTTSQSYLDNAGRPYDMGRGVGGGSLINGMCWTRGGSADYDAWVMLTHQPVEVLLCTITLTAFVV
jgi:choline dehydrogenase-like flavoprotein